MRDPDEGLAADGTIRTGASADRIRGPFVDLLADAVDEVRRCAPDASVYVFGSVATGQAAVGQSDVDLLTIGLATDDAASLTDELSGRYRSVCRSVDVGAAGADDFEGDHDEAYGNRVFLRHYCVLLAGPDRDRSTAPFPGDMRAARGFNGDIGRHRRRWVEAHRSVAPEVLGRRIARKALLAVAGIVSVHDQTWTTDRATTAYRLGELDPALAGDLDELLRWSDGRAEAADDDVGRVLHGVVDAIARRFADEIGLWPD